MLGMTLNSFGASKYLYPSAEASFIGGTSYCQFDAAGNLSFTFNTALCGPNGGSTSIGISVSWYEDTNNDQVGGVLVSGPTASNTGTTTYNYLPSTAVVGSKYYYVVVTWTDPTGCSTGGSLTSASSELVTVNAPVSNSVAGSPQTLANCATTTNLAGNTPTVGVGTWTCVTNCTGVGISTPGSPTSAVTGLTPGVATTFRWTIALAGCTSSSDDVVITAVSGSGCHVYCPVSGSSSTTGYLSNVTLNTINRTSVWDNGYINTGLSTTLLEGVAYDLSISRLNNNAYNQRTAAWIDWNDDGDFDDVGENVVVNLNDATVGSTTRTVSISPPIGSASAGLRMRVGMKYNLDFIDGTGTGACDSYATYIDWEDYTIVVLSPVNCAGTPTAGSASPATSSITTAESVALSWSQTYELGHTYQWQSGPSNTGPWTNVSGATSNTYTVPVGSPAGNTYFQLIITCTNSGLSNTSVPALVTVTPVYCDPGNLLCTGNDLIARVQFGTLDNNSGTTCTGTTGYSDYTAIAPPSFEIGTSNNISITSGSGAGIHSCGMWIDYNQNGSFLDPGEFTSIGQGTINASTVTTVPVVIPTTALSGTTRMRIQYGENSVVLSSWTCFSGSTIGETEDYMITIFCGTTPSDVTGRFPADALALPCGAAASLSWDSHSCATTGFKVYMDTNPSPTTLVSNSTETSYYTGNLASNTTYYWRIVPVSAGGDGASSIWSFDTQTAVLVAIADDSTECVADLCLEASGGAYPDYYWYDVPTLGVPIGTGSTYCPTGITDPTTYYVANVLQGAASSITAGTNATTVCGGGSAGSGFFFDIKAKSANLNITALDLMFEDISGPGVPAGNFNNRTVKVYYRPESYVGFSASTAGWTLTDNTVLAVLNAPIAVTNFDITDLFVPAGATYGIYVVYENAIEVGASLFSNVDIELSFGSVSCGGEFATIYNDFTFEGAVYYNIACSSPTIPVIATPLSATGNVVLAAATVISALEKCEEAVWTYYSDPADITKWLFAIDKNGNAFEAEIDIVESPTVYSNINAPGVHGSFLASRYWNARVISGTIATPVNVRFFFDTAEVRAAYDLRNFERTTNYPSANDVPWRWFKSVGVDFDPGTNIDGNNFNFTNITPTSVDNINFLGATYTGYINDVPYVEFTGVPSFSGGTGGFGFTLTGSGVLPVEFLNFDAELIERKVNLDWITETEINNDYFTVERSVDGDIYEVVGIVQGSGNSTENNTYELIDNEPVDGLSYYRLKQTDFDGEYFYSEIKTINNKKDFIDARLYPSPVKDNAFLSFFTTNEVNVEIQVVDVAGKLFLKKSILSREGLNKYQLDIDFLKSGMYFVSLGSLKNKNIFKFIKE